MTKVRRLIFAVMASLFLTSAVVLLVLIPPSGGWPYLLLYILGAVSLFLGSLFGMMTLAPWGDEP